MPSQPRRVPRAQQSTAQPPDHFEQGAAADGSLWKLVMLLSADTANIAAALAGGARGHISLSVVDSYAALRARPAGAQVVGAAWVPAGATTWSCRQLCASPGGAPLLPASAFPVA